MCGVLPYPYTTPEAERQGRPPMVHSSGRFKTTHTGCNLSAKAYGAVRQFETSLYGALFRGQSKKDIPMLTRAFFSCIALKRSFGVMC
jgi:hypothetical protein